MSKKDKKLILPSEVPLRGAELTARERLEGLFDDGDFFEIDKEVGHRAEFFDFDQKDIPGDGVITGFGKVNGKTVYAYAQDRSILGGSLGEAHARKICKIMDLALQAGCPIVGLNDSGGARIQEGIDALSGYGEIFVRNVKASGVIPQISVLMGPCAGGAVYSPALTDFIIMVKEKSYMFVTGPKVVKAVTSEDVTTEELGGASVHSSKSGVANFTVGSEIEALERVRNILSYLPQNNCTPPPNWEDLVGDKSTPALDKIIPASPNKPYEVKDVISEVFDDGSFLEVHKDFAQNIRVGFARLAGRPVGIVANNPMVNAGVACIDSSRKAARFIRMCDSFGLPIISLVDTPGFMPGTKQESGGIILHGSKLVYAYCEATVPKLTIIMRKSYGGAYICFGSKHVGTDYVFAFPRAEIAVMGAKGAVEILYAKSLKGLEPEEAASKAKEHEDKYNELFANPNVAKKRGYVDSVVDYKDARRSLSVALDSISEKRVQTIPKKHGNIAT